MSDRVRAHEKRLRAAFQRALLLSAGVAGGLQACGDDTIVRVGDTDAGDATLAADAPAALDGTAHPESSSDSSGFGDASAPDVPSETFADAAADGMDAPADITIDTAADAPSEDHADDGPWCAEATVGTPWWPDASSNCTYFVDLSCAQYPTNTCFLSGAVCLQLCTLSNTPPPLDCEYASPACTVAGRFVAEAGQPVTVACDLCPGAGRRPPGLRQPRARRVASNPVGEYFARAAHLEAASIHAFEHLRRELIAHGAPSRLLAAVERSARDEALHARAMRKLALRYGTEPQTPRIDETPVRSLERLARDNAAEGCVRETYGALVATWQASHARDQDVRRRFARIARDETRHAAVAWAIADWAMPRLDASARRRVAAARRRAGGRLMASIAGQPHPRVAAEAGMPTASQARMLLRAITALTTE